MFTLISTRMEDAAVSPMPEMLIRMWHIRFHDLRHTYAVISIVSGDDIKTVQENLGHHSAAFTLDQYGHVTEAMQDASAERMSAYIAGRKSSKG